MPFAIYSNVIVRKPLGLQSERGMCSGVVLVDHFHTLCLHSLAYKLGIISNGSAEGTYMRAVLMYVMWAGEPTFEFKGDYENKNPLQIAEIQVITSNFTGSANNLQ